MATRVKFAGRTVPDAQGTAGLPDVGTLKDIRENSELLWMACREIASRAGVPRTERDGQQGYETYLNVTSVMMDMWDGFDMQYVEPRRVRQILYRYLTKTGNMICVSRSRTGGRWWISETWNPVAPRNMSVPGASFDETAAASKIAAGTAVYVQYECKYPGCKYPRTLAAPQMGIHLKTHGIKFADYLRMATGELPWPDEDFSGVEAALDEPDTDTTGTGYADPVEAVMALVAENNRLRSLASESGLADENKQLREELSEALGKLAAMRRKLEAVDRMMGRR